MQKAKNKNVDANVRVQVDLSGKHRGFQLLLSPCTCGGYHERDGDGGAWKAQEESVALYPGGCRRQGEAFC